MTNVITIDSAHAAMGAHIELWGGDPWRCLAESDDEGRLTIPKEPGKYMIRMLPNPSGLWVELSVPKNQTRRKKR